MPTAEITRKGALISNFNGITARIAAARKKSGVPELPAPFMAVIKYAADEDVKVLVETGLVSIAGESRVQDARARWTAGRLAPLRSRVTLHFIGHLQANKAKAAVELFDWIDSVDSFRIAAEIDRHAAALGKVMPVLIQLKLSDSPTQSGTDPGKAGELLERLRELRNLDPRGYMGIAPAGASEGELRAVFAEARKVFDRDFRGAGCHLSLGMSGDFELAVEAGSTLPRIGSSLFA